ncbi:MAG: metalloregulator ArsR/SmtB family transcription factor [Chloroflexi bacterium]|nr:metalloregulator ArsR/SmtB family transcription factor [Chloroflexota bacterium]
MKILGLLAQRECSVDELATLLSIKAPTVSHHLQSLKNLGVVAMRKDGNDHLYRLDVDHLNTLSKDVFSSLSKEKVVHLAGDVEYDTWQKKVLETYVDAEQILEIPYGYKKRLVVLKWLINYFDKDKRYTEREVNEIIKQHHPDTASLRRAFISNKLMAREGGGGLYWRIPWQMPELK